MKKCTIATAVALALGAGSASAATTINLVDNTGPANPFPSALTANNAAFAAGNEFRVMSNGTASGFGEKSVTGFGEVWNFNSAGQLTGVSGTTSVPAPGSNVPNAAVQPSATYPGVGGTGTPLWTNATFFGSAFGFLSPTTSSPAGLFHGAATIQNISGDNFQINVPVAEAHWNNGIFTLGAVEGGVVFSCTGWTSPSGSCTGEDLIDPGEDSAGFAGQYAQWNFGVQVTTSAIPVPAAVWLFGSGVLGLVGVARRKKTAS